MITNAGGGINVMLSCT